jgi:hypothetical protein
VAAALRQEAATERYMASSLIPLRAHARPSPSTTPRPAATAQSARAHTGMARVIFSVGPMGLERAPM